MPTVKYWQNLGTFLDKAKEKISRQLIIYDTCLCHWQLLEVVYSREIQRILIAYTRTVIIFFRWWSSWKQMFVLAKHFFYEMNMNYIGKREHVLKHLHGRCVVGAFDNKIIWRIYLEWTHSSSIFYPPQINMSSFCTSWYKVLW